MADKSTQFSLKKDGASVDIVATDTIVVSTIEVDYKSQIVDIECNYDIKVDDPHTFYGVQTNEDWITITDKGEGKFRLLLKENFNPIVHVEDGTKYNEARLGQVFFYSYINTDDILELDIIQSSTEYTVELNGTPNTEVNDGVKTTKYNFNVVGGCEQIYIKSIVKVTTNADSEEDTMCYDDDLHLEVDAKSITITDFGMIEDSADNDIIFKITVAHKDNRLSVCDVEYIQAYTGEKRTSILVSPKTTTPIPAKGGEVKIDITTDPQVEWGWMFNDTSGREKYWLDVKEGPDALLFTAQSFNDTEGTDGRSAKIDIFRTDDPTQVETVEIKQLNYTIEQTASNHARIMAATYRMLANMTINMPPVYTYMDTTLIFDWDGTPVNNEGYIDIETTPSDSMIMAESLSYFVKCDTYRHRVKISVERSKSPEGHQGIVRIKNTEDNSSTLDVSIIQLPYTAVTD